MFWVTDDQTGTSVELGAYDGWSVFSTKLQSWMCLWGGTLATALMELLVEAGQAGEQPKINSSAYRVIAAPRHCAQTSPFVISLVPNSSIPLRKMVAPPTPGPSKALVHSPL